MRRNVLAAYVYFGYYGINFKAQVTKLVFLIDSHHFKSFLNPTHFQCCYNLKKSQITGSPSISFGKRIVICEGRHGDFEVKDFPRKRVDMVSELSQICL